MSSGADGGPPSAAIVERRSLIAHKLDHGDDPAAEHEGACSVRGEGSPGRPRKGSGDPPRRERAGDVHERVSQGGRVLDAPESIVHAPDHALKG